MAGEINISGLVGGFDYNSVLQQIQYLKSQQIYMMQDKQAQLNQKKAVIGDIRNILNGMEDALSNFDDATVLNAKSFNVANESILSATVTDQTKAQIGTYNISVNQLAKNHVMASSNTFTDKNTPINSLGNGTLSITQNGRTLNIAYDSTFSLQSLANKINTEASIWNMDIRATIVNTGSSTTPSYKLVLSSTKTGTDYQLDITSDTGNLSTLLGLTTIQNPQNASITIDGLNIQRNTNQFDDVIEGLSFNLKSLGNTAVTVSQNNDSIKQTLTNFVNSYNSLVEKITTETGKGGKLSGEYSLDRIKNTIFREVQDLVFSGIFNFDRNSGKLSLNNSKLDQILSNNSVSNSNLIETKGQLFTKLSEIKTNLSNFLTDTTLSTGTLGNMISMYDKQIASLQDSIDRMKSRVQMEIEVLKRQFIMMESIQAQYNAIGARIQATFGLNNNNK